MKAAWKWQAESNGIQLLILEIVVTETLSTAPLTTERFCVPRLWGHTHFKVVVVFSGGRHEGGRAQKAGLQ